MDPARQGVRASVAALTLASFLLAVTGPPAAAAAQTSALCTFFVHNHATPGFSLTPTQGVDTMDGSISCQGSVNGKRARPDPGTVHIVFNYASGDLARALGGASCLVYAGDGSMNVVLQADDGPEELRGTITSVGVVAAGEIHGQLSGAAFHGAVLFLPDPAYLDENCVTKPMEHFMTVGQLTLTG